MKKTGQGKKVLVAMSGGVDSAVGAALLLDQGYDVVGCFMRLGHAGSMDGDEGAETHGSAEHVADESVATAAPTARKRHHQGCCSVNDAADARLVAAILDIPFYVMNFEQDFGRVIDYFVSEYNAGRTPNPCIRCNTWLKFGKLAAYAQSIDADYIATGHYARIQHHGAPDGQPWLLRGLDLAKDQSYVLFGTGCDMLRQILLPIGDYHKPQVRRIAKRWNLPVCDKPDSQEICFVPDNDYFGLVRKRTPTAVHPGNIVDRDGNVLGEHDGHQRFTIGQRRGLSVSLGYPIYVTDKNPQTNTITVGDLDEVSSHGLVARQTNWLIDPPTDHPIACEVKIRSNGPAVRATVRATNADAFELQFEKPHCAVSPGQAAVCYDGNRLIGGGWIESCSRGSTKA